MNDRNLDHTWIWFCGDIVRADKSTISPFDEGLLYGRAVFETTRTFAGTPWLWPEHLARLLETCQHFAIPLRPDELPGYDAVAALVDCVGGDCTIRLTHTAGSPESRSCTFMTTRPLPSRRQLGRWQTYPKTVVIGDCWLTRKTAHYAERIGAKRWAVEAGHTDALLVNQHEQVMELATANVFFRLGNQWVTPPLGSGCLAGTVRRLLLDHLGRQIEETSVMVGQFNSITCALCTNSVLGYQPVSEWDGRTLSRDLWFEQSIKKVLADSGFVDRE